MERKRKGRPLLVAAAGVAFVSYVACAKDRPVGNLRGPDNDLRPDAEIAVGNLMPEPQPQDAGTQTATDAAPIVKEEAGLKSPPVTEPTHHPVGNLRPPPKK